MKSGLYTLRIAEYGLVTLQIVHFLFSMPVVIDHTHSTDADATAHARALCRKGSSTCGTKAPCARAVWGRPDSPLSLVNEALSTLENLAYSGWVHYYDRSNVKFDKNY